MITTCSINIFYFLGERKKKLKVIVYLGIEDRTDDFSEINYFIYIFFYSWSLLILYGILSVPSELFLYQEMLAITVHTIIIYEYSY